MVFLTDKNNFFAIEVYFKSNEKFQFLIVLRLLLKNTFNCMNSTKLYKTSVFPTFSYLLFYCSYFYGGKYAFAAFCHAQIHCLFLDQCFSTGWSVTFGLPKPLLKYSFSLCKLCFILFCGSPYTKRVLED
jgi:hypothetical protein